MQIPPNAPQWVLDLANTANGAAANARKAIEAAQALNNELKALKSSPRRGVQYVENIPGTRVPFDLLVLIPISAGESGPFTGSATISTDGPFVAVERVLTFMSTYRFQVLSQNNSTAIFNGRSYGRYRPTHSACDFLDAQGGFTQPIGAASPGTALVSAVSTNQHSGFRTMEWDGTVEVVAAGSGFRRQNAPVPSSIWAPGISGVSQLPALDFFAPAASIEFTVKSNHIANPNAGNVESIVGVLPFLDSQYDAHEGIGTAAAQQAGDDTITRAPNGILVVGYRGYRIVQPQGGSYEE